MEQRQKLFPCPTNLPEMIESRIICGLFTVAVVSVVITGTNELRQL